MALDPTLLDRLDQQLDDLDRQVESTVPEIPEPQSPGEAPPLPVGAPGGERLPQFLTVPESIFDRVTGAAGKGFDKPFGPPTEPGAGKQISTIGELGTAALKTAVGAVHGVFDGLEQALKETGVSNTTARRLTRDAFVALDSTIPLGIASPGAVLAAGKASRRAVFRAERKEKFQGMQEMIIAKRREDKAINVAAREVREAAEAAALKAGKSAEDANIDGALMAGKVDTTIEEVVQTKASELLRAPDQILDMIPATEITVLNREIQEQAVTWARTELRARGIDPTGLTPQRVQVLIMDLLNTSKNIEGFASSLRAAGFESIQEFGLAFIATGQDVANVAEPSAGIAYTELTPAGELYISITIPSLIVATHGGGTGLPTQQECLKVLGCDGQGKANKLAEFIAGVVLAGELSLGAAISSLDWVSSHEKYGRNR